MKVRTMTSDAGTINHNEIITQEDRIYEVSIISIIIKI